MVEMGESRTPRPSNPIKECTTGLVDVFVLHFSLPPTGYCKRWPSGLRCCLEGGPRHRTPRVCRPELAPRAKARRTSRRYFLGSESSYKCRNCESGISNSSLLFSKDTSDLPCLLCFGS